MDFLGYDSYFADLEDPRKGNRKVHLLKNIILISYMGTLCGCKNFVEIADWAALRKSFLEIHLDLSHGTPSHDTFCNVFSVLDPAQFATCFENWTQSLREIMPNDVIAFDGKSIRSSFDKPKSKLPIHLMQVWSCENKICLAQKRCDTKSNEIIALEQLLEVLDVRDQIVTADAMHCHKKTTQLITDSGADYVLGLKKNELKMHNFCQESFQQFCNKALMLEDNACGKGRKDTRIVGMLKLEDIDKSNMPAGWVNVNAFIMVDSLREEIGDSKNEKRYYLTSLTDPDLAFKSVRDHWQIENNLNRVLDVVFREDKSRLRDKNTGENFAYIRKMVINTLNETKTMQFSYDRMMNKALMDEEYMLKLLKIS